MIIETSHFVSKDHAIRYYLAYESGTYAEGKQYAAETVAQKIAEGEIHIGEPTLQPGQKLLVIDNGARYAIEESTKNPDCQNDKCKSATGEVRLLPCRRRSSLPAWESLKVYSAE